MRSCIPSICDCIFALPGYKTGHNPDIFQVMFDDNGGSGAAPLDNLTEDDIVLLDGDYDEVAEMRAETLVTINCRNCL